MSKYKVGDKIVLEIISGEAYGDYLAGSKEQNWWFNAEGLERGSEPLGTYTEPLETKIRRQAAEITRLLAENKELKEDFEKSKKEEIKVGDVVSHEEKNGVVISEGTICFRGFTDDGTPFEWYKGRCTKTGRHIDIDSFLKQIGGDE